MAVRRVNFYNKFGYNLSCHRSECLGGQKSRRPFFAQNYDIFSPRTPVAQCHMHFTVVIYNCSCIVSFALNTAWYNARFMR
jgi:hypothetical protein